MGAQAQLGPYDQVLIDGTSQVVRHHGVFRIFVDPQEVIQAELCELSESQALSCQPVEGWQTVCLDQLQNFKSPQAVLEMVEAELNLVDESDIVTLTAIIVLALLAFALLAWASFTGWLIFMTVLVASFVGFKVSSPSKESVGTQRELLIQKLSAESENPLVIESIYFDDKSVKILQEVSRRISILNTENPACTGESEPIE